MTRKLDRKTILEALALLDESLRDHGTTGEICIFGGAAMILAFDGKFATRDVDAIFVPKEVVNESIKQIADKLNLPENWLNDGVKGFASEKEDFTSEEMPVFDHLRVIRPSARYLLAMKCLASRVGGYGERGDVEDIKSLCRHLEIQSGSEVTEILLDYYPPERIPAKTKYLIEEIFPNPSSN